MNNRGEFKITSMLFSILLAFGLFFTLIASIISSLGGLYDASSFDEDSLSEYSHLNSLSSDIATQADSIDRNVQVNLNLFDYLGGIISSIIAPFKFIYQSYTTLFSATNQAVIDLNLFPEFATWVQAVIITLVMVGIVMFAVYFKVRQ